MMNMSLGLCQKILLKQMQMSRYESIGDLELLSLHKIKNRIDSLAIHPEVRKRLIAELFKENDDYRKSSGNNYMCITPSSLDVAVDNTIDYLTEQTELGLKTIDGTKIKKAFRELMSKRIDGQSSVIKKWFSDNYDNILHDMSGKIPFPIIRMMRDQLAQWALHNTNPFSEPITSLIDETASSVGLDPGSYDSYEKMWEALKQYR